MATQLNIKDPATIALARSLAARSGKSVTSTIRDALERADEAQAEDVRLRADRLLAELQAMTPHPRNLLAPEWRDKSSVEICNSIYTDDGDFAD